MQSGTQTERLRNRQADRQTSTPISPPRILKNLLVIRMKKNPYLRWSSGRYSNGKPCKRKRLCGRQAGRQKDRETGRQTEKDTETHIDIHRKTHTRCRAISSDGLHQRPASSADKADIRTIRSVYVLLIITTSLSVFMCLLFSKSRRLSSFHSHFRHSGNGAK